MIAWNSTVLQAASSVDNYSNLHEVYKTPKLFLHRTLLLLSAPARAGVETNSVAAGGTRWAALEAVTVTQQNAEIETPAFR